jgi:hypothetical protein
LGGGCIGIFFFFPIFILLCMKPLNNFIYFRARIC